MPRLRRVGKVSSTGRVGARVPVELTSRLHPMWLDSDAIAAFCSAHGIAAGGAGPLTAFEAVAEAYAVAQGWVRFFGDNPRAFADWAQLRSNGVPMVSCALELREQHVNVLGPAEMGPAEWAFIEGAEARALARTE